MITCSRCGSRVGVNGPCKVCTSVIHGEGCFAKAQRKARYGHRDWLVWHDEGGSHAAPKTKAGLKALLGANITSWSLICANDAIPMKGYDYLATNMLAQMEMGF